MISRSHKIGGVTVTFTVGHVNELRAIPVAQTGEVVQAASPDWWLKIPGIPADWPAGVLSPFHKSGPST